MNTAIETPEFLAPAEGVEGIGAFRALGIFEFVDRFARDFGIDHEIAFASLLAGFAHSVGGAFSIDSALGIIRPPFSLLLVTPESDAIWPRIPIRFLADDFENTLRAFAKLNFGPSPGQEVRSDAEPYHPEADRIANTVETAKAVYADSVAARIATSSLVAPFPRVPFDGDILLTTPHVGLRRGFRLLTSDLKIRLEHALSSNVPLRPKTSEISSAAPSFCWQLENREAHSFLEENTWFAGIPFLMLESIAPGKVILGPSDGCAGEIQRRCLDLFVLRHQAMRRPTTFSVDSKTFAPVQEFLALAQDWKTESGNVSPVRPVRVAESALRFALLFTILNQKTSPDHVAVHYGLELAKRLHLRHFKTLTKFLPINPTRIQDTADMSDRERAVFLRICERPGISPSELSRSFQKLRKSERDSILTTLAGRHIIAFRDGKLYEQITLSTML